MVDCVLALTDRCTRDMFSSASQHIVTRLRLLSQYMSTLCDVQGQRQMNIVLRTHRPVELAKALPPHGSDRKVALEQAATTGSQQSKSSYTESMDTSLGGFARTVTEVTSIPSVPSSSPILANRTTAMATPLPDASTSAGPARLHVEDSEYIHQHKNKLQENTSEEFHHSQSNVSVNCDVILKPCLKLMRKDDALCK